MIFKGLRVSVIMAVAAVSLILLFGGQWVYQRYTQDLPLEESLSTSAQVLEYEVLSRGVSGTVVAVELASGVVLSRSYLEVLRQVRQVYDGPVEVLVRDNRSPELEAMWARVQFPLYEGAAKDNLVEMSREVDAALAGFPGMTYRLDVDSENLYFQAALGENRLMEVIPRNGLIINREEGSNAS